ncbi:MAG: hypothetical protein WDN04_04495 [Rhodospirillales bacterium]
MKPFGATTDTGIPTAARAVAANRIGVPSSDVPWFTTSCPLVSGPLNRSAASWPRKRSRSLLRATTCSPLS